MRQKEKFKKWDFLSEEKGEATNFGRWKGRKGISRESRPYFRDFGLGRRGLDPTRNTFFKVGGVWAEQSAVISRMLGTQEYREKGLNMDYLPLVGDDGILSYRRRTGGVAGQVVARGKRRPVGIDEGEISSEGVPLRESVVELAGLMCRAKIDSETGVAALVISSGDEAVRLIWRGNMEKPAGAELAVLRERENSIDTLIFGVKKDRVEGYLRCWEQSAKVIGADTGKVFRMGEGRRSELVDMIGELPEAVGNYLEDRELTIGEFGESMEMGGVEKLGDLVATISMLAPNEKGERGVKIGTDEGRIIGVIFKEQEDGTSNAGRGQQLSK